MIASSSLIVERYHVVNPESTVGTGTGVDTRVDGQGKANGPNQIPIDGDEAA